MFHKENDLGFEIRELSILLGRFIDHEATHREVESLRGPQAWTLGFIKHKGSQPVYQKDIEEELSIRKPTASRLVDRMEKNGFVKRIASPEDKRLKQIIITAKAEENMKKIDGLIRSVETRIKKNLSPEEIQQFIATIHKIKKNVQLD